MKQAIILKNDNQWLVSTHTNVVYANNNLMLVVKWCIDNNYFVEFSPRMLKLVYTLIDESID